VELVLTLYCICFICIYGKPVSSKSLTHMRE